MHNGPDGFAWGDPEPKRKRSHRKFPEVILPDPPPAVALNKASEDEDKLREESDDLKRLLDAQHKSLAAAREMEKAVQRLESLATNGDQGAMEALYIVAARGIRALEQCFKTHPETIKSVAGQQIVWPALVSTKKNITKLNTDHITGLGLGKTAGVKLSDSKWGFENAYTKEAYSTLRRLEQIREIATRVKSIMRLETPEAHLTANKLLTRIAREERPFLEEIIPLPVLRRTNLRLYKPLLKRLFFLRIPNPEKLKQFSNVLAHSNRDSVSAQREKIFGLFIQAVNSLLLP